MKFDTYTFRARVMPAVITVLPILLLGSLAVATPIVGLVPAVGAIAIAVWCAEIVRQRGLALEQRLKRAWGGFPTTQMVRFSSHPVDQRLSSRRASLELVTAQELPDRSTEDSDPEAADAEIEQVIRIGIARVRDVKVESDLLQHENISYGFRRNLFALKPLGLVAVGVSIVGATLGGGSEPMVLTFIVGADALIGLFWLAAVTKSWVHEQAKKYAERFFVAIETIASSTPATMK
ncbi:MAG: hypothetical protein ACYC6C_12270 [Coriobacteriia bacterium]